MNPSGSVVEGKKKRNRELGKRKGRAMVSPMFKNFFFKKLRSSGLRGLRRPSSTWPLYRKALPDDVSFWRVSKE